jgi:hypothetical protein
MAMAGAFVLFGLGAAAGIAYFTAGSSASSAPQQAFAPAQEDVAPQLSTGGPRPVPPPPARAPARGPVRRPTVTTTTNAAPPSQIPPPAPAPAAAAADPRTELATRVREEAKAQFETYRNEIVSQCWPEKGLPRGARTAKLTINVTFDAQGHEIARGISEDRRAPAGEFGRCVRSLSGITLGVSPPGSNVAVSIPVSYP